MGVYISAFAVDADAFQAVIDQPLADLFRLYDSVFTGGSMFCPHFEWDGGRTRYDWAGGLQRLERGKWRPVPAWRYGEDPLLATRLKDYLVQDGSSIQLDLLLEDLAFLPRKRVAVHLTNDYRRWWIGSMLETVRSEWLLSPEDARDLETFCGRVLRGWDCGVLVSTFKELPPRGSFPFVPTEEDNHRVAIFSEVETRHFGDLLHRVATSDATFKGVGLNRLDDWTDWVHRMTLRLGRLRNLPLPNLQLVTFIG